jgi:DNA-binding PadR family transcriptional regulator
MANVTKQERAPGSFLPLHQTVFYILGVLVERPKHGYQIAKDIEELSDGDMRIAIGNLYVSLKRLLDDGLIERVSNDSEEDRRKVYRITGLGAQVVKLELDRIRNLELKTRGIRGALEGATG